MAETTDEAQAAFPYLSDEQLDVLRAHGVERRVAAGEVLFAEGDPAYDLFVLIDVRVRVSYAHGTADERELAVREPRQFLGELNLLTGGRVYVTATAMDAGTVLVVPAAELRRLVGEEQQLSDLVLRAFLRRRTRLTGQRSGLLLVGHAGDAHARELREFVIRNRLPYDAVDAEADPEAAARLAGARTRLPAVVLRGAEVLERPSVRELATALGLRQPAASAGRWDVVVVGAGPGGLGAAVYAASEGLRTLGVEAIATGGQAGTSSRIENYLGFPAGLSGDELAYRAALQADKFGAERLVPERVVGLVPGGEAHELRLDDGTSLQARAVILATGATYRKPQIDRLEDFEGRGISYAATVRDAELCGPGPLVVVGGGNSAGQAAAFLARQGRRVLVVVRRDGLEETMSQYLVEQLAALPSVEVIGGTEVVAAGGDERLSEVVLRDRAGNERRLAVGGLFVFIGADPRTAWLDGTVALDRDGFVLTGADLPAGGALSHLETSVPGVFAAGDVRSGSIKRVASAVGEGAMAVALVHQHLQRVATAATGPS